MTLSEYIYSLLTGEWQSRAQLARQMGRYRTLLNGHDIDILNALVKDRKVEMREVVIGSAVKRRFEYRKLAIGEGIE